MSSTGAGSERPIRAVIFDYGHTLVDFTVPEDALHEVYGRIRERLVREAKQDLPASPDLVELVARHVTRAVEESYARDRLVELDILGLFRAALRGLGFSPAEETVRWVAETEHEALAKQLVCPADTVATLRLLKQMGLKIGIVSNAHLLPYMMRRDWINLGFGQLVDGSVISCELGFRKPDPRIFDHIVGQLGIDAATAVFVGDRLYDDVGGAHSVGMRGVLTREFRQEEVADDTQPDFVIEKLAEIVPFISALTV